MPKKKKTKTKAKPVIKRSLGYVEDGFYGFSIRDRSYGHLTDNGALNTSTVFCGVNLISTISNFPLILYRQDDNVGREKAKDLPLYKTLRFRPNALMTSKTFWALCIKRLCLKGNFFAEKIIDGFGNVRQLIPIDPGAVTVFKFYEKQFDGEGNPIVDESGNQIVELKVEYEVMTIAGGFRLKPDRMFHVHINSADGIIGRGIVEFAANSLGVSLALEKATHAAANNITMPSLVITAPTNVKINPESRKATRDSWEAEVSGPENVGRILFADMGQDVKPLTLTVQEFAFLNQRKFQVEEWARWFDCSPSMLQDQSNSHYASLLSDMQFLIQRCLAKYAVIIEQEINRQLVNEDDQDDLYAEFLLDHLLRGTTLERYQAYATGIQAGWLLKSECREMENRPVVEGIDAQPMPALGGSALPGQVNSIAKTPNLSQETLNNDDDPAQEGF